MKGACGIGTGHGFAGRATFVVGRNGRMATLRGLKREEHVAHAPEITQELARE